MPKRLILSLLAASLPLTAFAQAVPAIDTRDVRATYMPAGYRGSAPPSLPVLSADSVSLNMKEKQAVSITQQWQNAPIMPSRGDDGTVSFVYGATQPSVICAPQHVCDVALQSGETVSQVDVGDASRWKVTPATSGTGETAVTHIVIKPADAGLSTNLLVHTDKRTYNIQLVSKRQNWTPLVAFSYPDDTQAAWADYKREHQAREPIKATVQHEASPTVAHSNLDFDYSLKGDTPTWKPVRVYSDENKTYIQFPAEASL